MDKTTDLLVAAARKAGEILARLSRQRLEACYKAPHELVTVADRLSHTIIADCLSWDFPDLPVVLEEQAHPLLPDPPFLVGDELDGTAVFAAGTADWGISLALIDEGPTHGVIFLPDRELLITARRHGGCQINGADVRLRSAKMLSEIVWGTELNPRLSTADRRFNDALVQATLTTRCTGCSSAGVTELLLGHTDLYLNCGGGKIWDFAAGVLAVEEAGGVACRADGSPMVWDRLALDVLLAASPELARAALALRPV